MPARYPDLQGRTVVITGASRGIGAQTARAFAEQGASVAVLGLDAEALAAVAAEAGGLAIRADVTQYADLEAARERVEGEFGPADVLCAFAGGQGMPVPTWELTPERWREVVDTDLTSAFLTIRAFLPGMIERGRGAIVTMASSSGRQPSKAN